MLIQKLDFKESAGSLLDKFKGKKHLFLLDSSLVNNKNGRYSFFGFDPFTLMRLTGKNSLAELKDIYARFADASLSCPETPFACGIVGYVSYDYGLYGQKFQANKHDIFNVPDVCFAFYDTVLTLDHQQHVVYVTSSGLPEKDSALRSKRARQRLGQVLDIILTDKQSPSEECLSSSAAVSWQSNFSRESYMGAINHALERIAGGDIYQVNLSQCFHAHFPGGIANPSQLYQRIRESVPSSFSAYFDAGDLQVLSSSPERFLTLRERLLTTQPMKGTRARGKTAEADRRLKQELLDSRKEAAELLMVTDLQRNDLGKVCVFGSVRVEEMRAIEAYHNVFQATSTVSGTLLNGKDAFDALKACFPGGSVTGCPKIKAMEIINSLEPLRRGLYTGALGYIGFNGNMDFNILIRTLLVKGEGVFLQAGGGIVADSDPQAEYEETLLKAEALKNCVDAFVRHQSPTPVTVV